MFKPTLIFARQSVSPSRGFITRKGEDGVWMYTSHWQLSRKSIGIREEMTTNHPGEPYLIGYLIPLEDDDEKT